MTQATTDGDVSNHHVEINTPILYLTTLIQSTGASLLWPITTLYIHNVLKESMTIAGVVLMLTSFAIMLGNWLGGWLFDHWFPHLALISSVAVAFIALISLIFLHTWPWFAIFMLILGVADGNIYTLLNSYATTVTSIDLRRVFNFQYLFMNVGVVIGTVFVGLLFDHGVQYVFSGATIMYAVFLYLAIRYFKIKGMSAQASRAAAKAAKSHFTLPPLVYALIGLVFSTYMGYILWETVIATHMTALGMSTQDYSFLWTLNGMVIIIGGILINRVIDRLSFKITVLGGSFMFALSFIFLIFSHTYGGFIMTFMVLTLGEMLMSPQIPAWIDHIGDPNAKGQSQGLVTMFTSLGRAVGPMYGGIMIDAGSYQLLFGSIFILMTLFILIAAYLGRQSHH